MGQPNSLFPDNEEPPKEEEPQFKSILKKDSQVSTSTSKTSQKWKSASKKTRSSSVSTLDSRNRDISNYPDYTSTNQSKRRNTYANSSFSLDHARSNNSIANSHRDSISVSASKVKSVSNMPSNVSAIPPHLKLEHERSNTATTSGSELTFAPEIITQVREYCNDQPSSLVKPSGEEPLYQPVNFIIDPKDFTILRDNTGQVIKKLDANSCSSAMFDNNTTDVANSSSSKKTNSKLSINTLNIDADNKSTTSSIRSTSIPASRFTSKADLARAKVRLDRLKISKYHLNGWITCASLSMEQHCYVRVSTDNWTTFQETQAIEVGDFDLNGPSKYQFDFLIPMDRSHDVEATCSSISNGSSSKGREGFRRLNFGCFFCSVSKILKIQLVFDSSLQIFKI